MDGLNEYEYYEREHQTRRTDTLYGYQDLNSKLKKTEKELQELKEKYDKLVEQVQRDECYDCEYKVKL